MEKLQLKIPVILPQVPNEKDSCVERLIQKLQAKSQLQAKRRFKAGYKLKASLKQAKS